MMFNNLKMVCCAGVLFAVSFLGLACDNSNSNISCKIENHCIANGTGGRCKAGYEWENLEDPQNYNCILIGSGAATDAGTSSAPSSATEDAGSSVGPPQVDAGTVPPVETDAGEMSITFDAGTPVDEPADSGVTSPSHQNDAGVIIVPSQPDAGDTIVATCEDGGMQLGESTCGLNNNGRYIQLCSSGQWQDTDTCSDSDVCVNEAIQTGTTVCGVQSGGFYREECINGQWEDTDYCIDPDLVVTEVPDPDDIVPALPSGGRTSFFERNSFLFESDTPVQQGVNPEVFSAERMGVMRGYVFDESGNALKGVRVEFPQEAEFGWTLTREDGAYDIAINGGKDFLMRFSKEGYLQSHRRFIVSWRENSENEPVRLKPIDTQVTAIALGNLSDAQVASGSLTSDERGTRQSRVIVPTGTSAQLVHSDGTIENVESLSIRSTEYTVGEDGPTTMPGQLPATSGYTYAMELSADEADVAGATSIVFDPPVFHYVENFIDVPVGESVPAGYYDKEKGYWVASDNGLVIEILSVAGGTVTIDADGDGLAEDVDSETNLNITAEEKAQLAALYAPGQTLWRVPIPHFTPWDCNYPVDYPSDAETPSEGGADSGSNGEDSGKPDKEDECSCDGSIIECESQVLRESVPVVGTNFNLNYRSSRGIGFQNNTITTSLIDDSVPDSLKKIDLKIEIAGLTILESYDPSANLLHEWTWDGFDAYGRELKGVQPGTITVTYTFDGVYRGTGGSTRDFGTFPESNTDNTWIRGTNGEVGWSNTYEVQVGQVDYWKADGFGLGGWSLSPHHVYDPEAGVLHKGDGETRATETIKWVLRSAAGTGNGNSTGTNSGLATDTPLNAPSLVTTLADGSYYIGLNSVYKLRYVDVDGYISNVEKVDNPGDLCSDNMRGLGGIAHDGINSVYFTTDDSGDWGLLCRWDLTTNQVHHVAGNLSKSTNCDVGRADEISLGDGLEDVSVGPDGSIYFVDSKSKCIRRVGLDGTVERIVGKGNSSPANDLDARDVRLDVPQGLDVTAAGEIYIADYGDGAVYRVGVDGDFSVVASQNIGAPRDVAVSEGGMVYITNAAGRVWQVDPYGGMEEVMGGGSGWREFAASKDVSSPNLVGIDLLPGHTDTSPRILIGSSGYGSNFGQRVYLLAAFSSKFIDGQEILPSSDGLFYYVFDATGKHLSTRHLLTEAIIYEFGYDEDNHLATVTDAYGLTTTLSHDSDGNLTSIESPFGQVTTIVTNGDGMMTTHITPGSSLSGFSYVATDLLASYANANNDTHVYAFDADGRLTSDTLPNGGTITLSREITDLNYTLTKTSPEGLETTFSYENNGNESGVKTITYPSGDEYVFRYHADGSREYEFPSGMIRSIQQSPDPRFGMRLPYISSQMTTYPSGDTHTIEQERTLEIPDIYNLLYVSLWTDTFEEEDLRTSRTLQNMDDRTIIRESAGGKRNTATYNNKGRLVSITHDSDTSSEEDVNSVLNLTYDASNGLLIKAENTQSSYEYVYDAKGRVQTRVDALGNTLTYGYDDDNNLVSVLLNDESTSFQFEYDSTGIYNKVIMPTGVENNLVHGFDGQIEEYTPPGASQGVVWSYGLDRRLNTVTAMGGGVLDLHWNQDRLSGYESPAEVAAFTFGADDVDGKKDTFVLSPKGAGNEASTQSMIKDGNRLVRSVGSGATVFDVGYSRNVFGEVTTETFTSGDVGYTKTRSYNDEGLVIAENDLSQNRMGPFGQPLSIYNTDESFTQVYVYDAEGHLVGKTLELDGSTLYDIQLSYNAAGYVSDKEENINSETQSRSYVYSDRGALESVTLNSISEESFSYDSHGNRAVANGENAIYDNEDRIVSMGDWTYSFDSDGALSNRANGVVNEAFLYSLRGTLLSASSENYNIKYSHDAFGRLIKKVSDSETIEFFYMNPEQSLQLSAYKDGSGELVELLYDGNNHLVSLVQGSDTYYVATDHLGTPRAVFDDNGTLEKEIHYSAFGEIIIDTNSNFLLPVGFAGGLADRDTGLLRFGLRDYDPASGRWTSRDPVLYASHEVNLYRYVGNNPTTFRDPMGLWTFSIGFSVSFSAGPIQGSIGFGVAIGQDDDGNWQIGGYDSLAGGVLTGGGIDADASLDFGFSTNDCICDLGGASINVGGSGGALGHLGGDVGFSLDGADPVVTGSVGIGVGGSVGGTYTETNVNRWY